MPRIEIIKALAIKEMELTVERPVPKKGDREIAERTLTTLSAASKLRRIAELVEGHRATLIFVNTRQMAEILASRLRLLGLSADIHHSSLSRESREKVEEEFKRGSLKALICTSSLELGIDIGSVELVIQYSSPRQVTRLVQRAGRSGHRIKESSKAVIIADSPDDILESLVIIRRARAEQLEEPAVFEKPYDVLAHQIAGLVLDLGEISKEDCYRVLRRAWVNRALSREEFDDVLAVLQELRLIWVKDEVLQRSRKTRAYYYENISTIPDEKKYEVRSTVTRERIGVLDESFVAGMEEGELVIFKGRPWHVVAVEEGVVHLEPVSVVAGEVPSWVGEEIPVEYEVAREAGSLRSRDIDGSGLDRYTARTALKFVRRQVRMGLPVPDHRRMVVELLGELLVIHSPFGLKVNETLGRVFSTILSARTGHSVVLRVDPYRIILQAKGLSEERALQLFQTPPSLIEPLLAASLKRTTLFRWKFVHVARRFGALSRDVDYRSIGLARVIRAWEDTPIFKETLREVFTSKLDVERAEKVLGEINTGRIGLEILRLEQPSPIAEAGMESFTEVVLPERAEKMILQALRNRIQNERVTLFCAYCGGWHESFLVRNIPEAVKCRRCGARMIAPLTRSAQNTVKAVRRYKQGVQLQEEERREVRKAQLLGGLFLSYGKVVAEVIAARGVGPETAKRILSSSRTEEELYRNILRSEREYARTRRFWD